jgi:hypothetical protein
LEPEPTPKRLCRSSPRFQPGAAVSTPGGRGQVIVPAPSRCPGQDQRERSLRFGRDDEQSVFRWCLWISEKSPEKLSPLLQQGAPRGSLAPVGEGRGEASRGTASIVEVSESQFVSCSDRKGGTFGPSAATERNIRTIRTLEMAADASTSARTYISASNTPAEAVYPTGAFPQVTSGVPGGHRLALMQMRRAQEQGRRG